MLRNPFNLQKTDKKLAVLIDPDKHKQDDLLDFVSDIQSLKPDFIFIGGSLIYKSNIDEAARLIKATTDVPLILFPGHFTQLTDHVDAVLLLSLISGRNPDLLIGQHVLAAPQLKAMKSEKISTAYLLVDGGRPTSVSYMSNTQPIPRDKIDIALCTAQAGELIGMSLTYLDAGSGALQKVPLKMVEAVARGTATPLVVGGGIRTDKEVEAMWNAGANLVVVGNALEEKSNDAFQIQASRKSLT